MRRTNWQIVIAFPLSLVAMFSYPYVFVRWPITRDVPWVNLLMFALAGVLTYQGIRHAWQPGRWRIVRIAMSTVLAGLTIATAASFVHAVLIASRRMPASAGAPQVGQRAPEFTLADVSNKPIALSALLSEPIDGRPTRGVLLIFYRGYW